MPTHGEFPWPTVVRDDELRPALAALEPDSEFQGVALIGESGIGKSTLARALADTLRTNGHQVRFVLGIETGRDVPLGAFSRSVNIDTAREPAAMLAAAHQSLHGTAKLVIVVDDAQLLDPLSATLIYQLAAYGTARLIVTLRSGEPPSSAVTALLKERLLLHLHIGAFTREQTGELARRVLGDDVDAELVDNLQRRCGGNPLWLRGLLRPGREAGALVHTAGGWTLQGPMRSDRELLDLVEFRLHSLTLQEREAVEVLAVAEVLDWQILREMCGSDAAAGLERCGLIQLIADGSHLVVQLNHPVFGEAAVHLAGAVRCRQIYGELVRILQRRLPEGERSSRLPDARGWMRLAEFMIRSDVEPDLKLLISAAATAAAMLNLGHAEELARFAFEHGGGPPAAVELANALSWQGRADEAEAVFADAVPGPGDESVDEVTAVTWGCLRAANLFLSPGKVEQGRQLLAATADRAQSAAGIALVNAPEIASAFFAGAPARALEAGPAMCASDAPPLSTVWVSVPTAHALQRAGRFDEVAPVVKSGLQAAQHTPCGPLPFALGLAQVIALLGLGDLPAAERAIAHYGAMAAASSEGSAMIDTMLGMVHQARGELPQACSAFRNAVSVLSQGYRSAWVVLVASWWAQVEGVCGNAAATATALAHAESAFGPHCAVFEPELELARAWEQAVTGDLTAGRSHALKAAQRARASTAWGVEMWALHTAMRLGDRSTASRLADLSRTLTTPWAQATATHARGLADYDGELLDAAADQFAATGATALAADAAAHAAAEHARSGEHNKHLESSARAQRFANESGSRTPAVVAATVPLPLTDRQREIATLAAAGLSNREIAEKLCVSIRTVDGHIYRIFGQLGIENRTELAGVLGGTQSGS